MRPDSEAGGGWVVSRFEWRSYHPFVVMAGLDPAMTIEEGAGRARYVARTRPNRPRA